MSKRAKAKTEKKREASKFEKSLVPAFERNYPTRFDQCVHAVKTTDLLRKLCERETIESGLPNIMLYGPEGSGKYARAIIALCELFQLPTLRNGTVKAIDPNTGGFTVLPGKSGTKKTQKAVCIFATQIHCEIDIQQSNAEKSLIKFLDYYSRTKNAFLGCHKYVIIRHANRISQRTQNALRRVMETKTNTVRFLVTSKSKGAWIEPLQSRFLCLPVESPREKDAIAILKHVATKENWKLTPTRIKKILENSRYGVAGHIHLTEMLMVAEGSFISMIGKRSFKVYVPDRVRAVAMIIQEMKHGNREKIRNVLEKIGVLMADTFVMLLTGDLFRELLGMVNEEKKFKLIEITAYWNHRLSDDTIFYPLLAAEAYVFAVCDLLGW